MKLATSLTLTFLLAVALAAPAHAGEGDRGSGAGQGKDRGHKLGRLFKRFDENEDGALTSDEVPERLWSKISKADADGNGAVTKEELRAAHKERRGKRRGGRGGRGGGG